MEQVFVKRELNGLRNEVHTNIPHDLSPSVPREIPEREKNCSQHCRSTRDAYFAATFAKRLSSRLLARVEPRVFNLNAAPSSRTPWGEKGVCTRTSTTRVPKRHSSRECLPTAFEEGWYFAFLLAHYVARVVPLAVPL